MRVQNCYFANLLLIGFFPFSLPSPSSLLKLPNMSPTRRFDYVNNACIALSWGHISRGGLPHGCWKRAEDEIVRKAYVITLTPRLVQFIWWRGVFCCAWLIERSRRCWLGRLLWWYFSLFFNSLCCIWRFSICVDRLRIASKFTEVDGSVDDGLEHSVVSWTA